MAVQVSSLDHIVFFVTDPARTLAWYVEHLGCVAERVEEWEAGDAPFPSVRIDATTIIDLFPGEPSGTNVDHICVVVDPATDLDALAAGDEFDVVEGPRRVWGALGWGQSVYVRDPDGHTVELRTYPD